MGTDVRAQVWAKTNGQCWYCGIVLNPWGNFCIDHATSKHKGGSSDIDNLLPACQSCNSRKRAKTLEEFREYLTAKTLPKFTDEQLAYLADIGVVLPEILPPPPQHRFWGEKHT